VRSSYWSQYGRPLSAELCAAIRSSGARRSAAASARDTMTAVLPSTGMSQSSRHSGSEIIRASRYCERVRGSRKTALGLSAALARWLTASAPSCSRVVPYSWKCRRAIIADQFAAETAPNGTSHCCAPSMRSLPVPTTEARRPAVCAVLSHTVRKHSTWFASPADTAAQALMTAPSCPEDSIPPLNQVSESPSASSTSQHPTPENPGEGENAPGQVETPSMSAVVSPASAIASSAASTVRDSADRPSRLPTCDCPMPLISASVIVRPPAQPG